MAHISNAARDRRRAEARILRAAREALLKEMEAETSKPSPDVDRIAFLSTKARKVEASLSRYEEREPKPPKLDGRTTPAKAQKEADAKAAALVIPPLAVVLARMQARRKGVDLADPEAMKPLIAEGERALKAHEARRALTAFPTSLPGDDV